MAYTRRTWNGKKSVENRSMDAAFDELENCLITGAFSTAHTRAHNHRLAHCANDIVMIVSVFCHGQVPDFDFIDSDIK